MIRDKEKRGSSGTKSGRSGRPSLGRWLTLLALFVGIGCASGAEPSTSDVAATEQQAVTTGTCSDVPAEFKGVRDGCDCPANGNTSCDTDCTVQGNPGGAYCGCQYCFPEEPPPPPTGTSCDWVPHEYVGVHDGCDCPDDGNTSCDPDCAEGNIADEDCGCQFCYHDPDPDAPPPVDPYAIELPNRMSPQMVTLYARRSLDVRADAQVRRGPRGFGRVVNTNAQGTTTFGARSRVGETWSACSVTLGNDADVGGTVYSPGPVTQGTGSDLLGGAEAVPTLPDMTVHTWQPNPPARTGGDKTVSSGTTTLNPGGYGNVRVNAGGTIRLVGGVYHVGDLTVASGGKLRIDDTAGPVYIYVDGAVNFDGTVVNNSGVADDNLEVVIVVRGGGVVRFGGPFSGTVYAPQSPVSLLSPGNPGYHGTYFGNDVVLGPGVVVWHVSFPWGGLQPNAPKRWDVLTIHLDASVTNATGQTRPEEKTLAEPVNFTIPAVLPVRNGNAGTGTARLKFRLGSEPIVTCTYRGAAGVAHPTTLLARMKGMIYDFSSCSDGSVVGEGVLVDWVSLEVVNGDAQDASKQTEVSIDSEDGCSAYIPPPLHPWEVVDLKSKFAWRTEKALPETDPSGRPALWHGLIYIENREQLAALDRLRIFWSARPLSATYTEQMRGLCGRVEHATDGTGVVVYAVFPAKFFNIIRSAGIQAERGGFAPPFRFIIPSTPEAEFANSDGSIAYDALASSGFRQWLLDRAQLSPGFWSKITKPFRDAGKWVNDNIIQPVLDGGQNVIHYTVDAFDELIDAVVPIIDDIWETTQEALALIAFAIEEDVGVHLDVRLANLDPDFPANSYLVRAWGPPCTAAQATAGLCGGENPTSGTRPILLPTGTKFRIRQWGFGFLPVMKEKTLGANGQIDLRALKNRTGRGGDFCVQLEADYGMITTDLIPNEVCDFATNRYGDFEREVNDTLVIRQDDLHAFAQIKDGYDYNRSVLGREPYAVDVLTGWPANLMTSVLNGDPRAMTLCLDFPGIGATTVAGLSPILTLGLGGPIYSKDIWWPDSRSSRDSRNSRVMTHEYGHFTMCDLLYSEQGPVGLTGLAARTVDGEIGRGAETGIMTETIADLYALQVAGGTNYVGSDQSRNGAAMSYCAGPLCMDWNYRGANDNHNASTYRDEIARWVSLTYDAFDRGDASTRTANSISNSDYWTGTPGNPLTYSPTPYLGRDDEPVTLTGAAWLTWVQKWLDHGRTPSIGNVMAGLFDTVRQNHTFCDACELLASHHPAASAAVLMNPTAARPNPTRSVAVRTARIDFCMAHPEHFNWLGSPPRADGRFGLNCLACGPSQYVDTITGSCFNCPPGNIATLHGCSVCPAGTVPSANNDCRRCGANQISTGNTCVTCPFGQAADAATNACVFCEADAVVDWATTTMCGQTVQRTVPVNGVSGDHCPNDGWLEVRNIASGPFAGNFTSFRAQNYFSPDISVSNTCTGTTGSIRVTHRSGAALITDINQSRAGTFNGVCDGFICPPEFCSLPVVPALTKAQVTTAANTLRILVGATRSGVSVGTGVKLTLAPTNPPTSCGPR